jgi:anti-anti-sigma regulatory factor
MSTTFKIEPNDFGSFDHFALHGNIDAHAEKELQELPHSVRHRLVKIDFGKTGRINSMGIAMLLRCLKTIREEKQADIRLLALNPTNTILFKMTGVFLLASPEK